ncbi:MAG: hypothetical protein DMG97_19425 [Acidobacteria bacterium]|nr:MAG: hypothetical protein DMG97_19425 [Acidobacteriota bacterium]
MLECASAQQLPEPAGSILFRKFAVLSQVPAQLQTLSLTKIQSGAGAPGFVRWMLHGPPRA